MATRAARAPAMLQSFVLHRYDWSESSLILDLFTREQGRLAVAAKGAKRPHSQLRPVLLPFQRLHVALARARADAEGAAPPEVMTLRSVDWAGGASMLTGAALFAGFHCNELVMKFLARQDAHPLLFDAYADTLPVLADADEARVQAALRAFELVLLRECGLLPDLAVVTQTQQAVRADARFTLLADSGVAPARAGDAALAGATLVGLQAALAHGSMDALRQACRPALPELKALLRGLVHYHLGTASLRTRRVMMDLQSIANGTAR